MKVNGNRARQMWKSFAKGQILLTVRIEWARRRLEKQIRNFQQGKRCSYHKNWTGFWCIVQKNSRAES